MSGKALLAATFMIAAPAGSYHIKKQNHFYPDGEACIVTPSKTSQYKQRVSLTDSSNHITDTFLINTRNENNTVETHNGKFQLDVSKEECLFHEKRSLKNLKNNIVHLKRI